MRNVVYGQVGGPESLRQSEELEGGQESAACVLLGLGECVDCVDCHGPGVPGDGDGFVLAVWACFDQLFGFFNE